MKDNTTILVTTAQCLNITSQVLAIGIEVAIIAGGYLLYKQIKKEIMAEEKEAAIPVVVQQVPYPSKPEKKSFKEVWSKTKKIFKAVVG